MNPILVVDDEPQFREVISPWAESSGYVALTARPHRAALPSSDAMLELCRGRDAQFDPGVVEAFVHMLTAH